MNNNSRLLVSFGVAVWSSSLLLPGGGVYLVALVHRCWVVGYSSPPRISIVFCKNTTNEEIMASFPTDSELRIENEKLKAKLDATLRQLQQYEANAGKEAAKDVVQRTKIDVMSGVVDTNPYSRLMALAHGDIKTVKICANIRLLS